MFLRPPEPLQSMMMLLGCGSSGGGVTVSDEAAQFLARLAPEPETTLRADYIAFIDGCVDAGLWELLECVQALAVDHEGQAVVNLKSDSAIGVPEYDLGGTLTWIPGDGYSSSDLAKFSTEFDPSAASIFTLNAGFVGFYSLTAAQINSRAVAMGPSGSATLNDKISIYPRWSDNFAVASCGSAAGIVLVAETGDSDGWYVVQRNAASGAGAVELRKNTTQKGTDTTASAAYTAGEKVKLQCLHKAAFFVAGAKLTSGQHDALSALVAAFLTGRGAI